MYVIRTYCSVVLCITFGISRAQVEMRLPCKRGEPINKYRTYLVMFGNENSYGIYKIGKRKGIGRQFVQWQIIPSYSIKKNCLISIWAKDVWTTDFHTEFHVFLMNSQMYLIVFFIVCRYQYLSSSYFYLPISTFLPTMSLHTSFNNVHPFLLWLNFSLHLSYRLSCRYFSKNHFKVLSYIRLHPLLLNVPLMCSLLSI